MEPTIFTGWVYDHLLSHAAQLKVAHPFMLRAIAASALLLETGVAHDKQWLPKAKYFRELLATNPELEGKHPATQVLSTCSFTT